MTRLSLRPATANEHTICEQWPCCDLYAEPRSGSTVAVSMLGLLLLLDKAAGRACGRCECESQCQHVWTLRRETVLDHAIRRAPDAGCLVLNGGKERSSEALGGQACGLCKAR
jgi:hypothetical protein